MLLQRELNHFAQPFLVVNHKDFFHSRSYPQYSTKHELCLEPASDCILNLFGGEILFPLFQWDIMIQGASVVDLPRPANAALWVLP